jgi:hypothetical protein
MKKSQTILLGLTLVLAQACGSKEIDESDWTYGETNSKDTTVRGQHYRSYHGYYYPVFRNRIAPAAYQGATLNDIHTPAYTPKRVGGFGRTGGSRSVWS